MYCTTEKPITISVPTRPEGPSSTLVSRINHLGNLLKNLPTDLPLNPPESTYWFRLDAEKVQDKGVWFAVTQSLEVCFKTYKNKGSITFRECSARLDALIKMLREAVKGLTECDRAILKESWIEIDQSSRAAKGQDANKVSSFSGQFWTDDSPMTQGGQMSCWK